MGVYELVSRAARYKAVQEMFIHRIIPYEVSRQRLALLTILSFVAIL